MNIDLTQQFLEAWEREYPTTLKVLKAFPATKGDFKPHERSRSARELAWNFVNAQQAITQALDGTFAIPPNFAPAPGTFGEVVHAYEQGHAPLAAKLRRHSENDVLKTMKLLVSPKEMRDVPVLRFLWFVFSDTIHHRGQLSVYLRMAGGKVPSIYGPSADEPWF